MKKILLLLIVLLLVQSVSATLTITRTNYSKPDVTLSLVSGGSLAANTTYYYRVAIGDSYILGSCKRVSPMSDVKNITTDSTHRSVNISVDTKTGADEYLYVWVSINQSVPKGHWFDRENYGEYLWYLGEHTYQQMASTNTLKDNHYLDDGTHGYTSTIYQLSNTNYAYAYPKEAGADYIEVSSDDLADPITLQKIYDYAVNQSWPLNSTIKKEQLYHDAITTDNVQGIYTLEAARITIDGTVTTKFTTANEMIILDGTDLYDYAETQIGEYNSLNDLTYDGDFIITSGHGTTFGSISFYATAGGELNVYDTKFLTRKADASGSNAYGSSINVMGNDWHFIDSGIEGRGTSEGFNNGFYIVNSASDGSSSFKRCYTKYNRWESIYSTPNPVIFDGFDIYMKSNSGLWIRHTDEVERVITGLNVYGNPFAELYATVWNGGTGQFTWLNLIDSYLEHPEKIYWYGYYTGYEKSYIKFSYTTNYRILDANGDGLAGVNITLKDNTGNVIFTNITNSSGQIGSEVVTNQVYKPNYALNTSHFQDPDYITDYGPFTLSLTKSGVMSYETSIDINQPLTLIYTLRNPETILLEKGGGVVTV